MNVRYFQFIVRVARASNTNIIFPIIITTVPPSSLDPVLSPEQIYRVLAMIYRAARAVAEFANNAKRETKARGKTVNDGSGVLVNGTCLTG